MPADVIVYAVVAAGLVFWLRSILGTRHGEERERPNPYTPDPLKKADPSQPYLEDDALPPFTQNGNKISFPAGSIYAIENKTAENEILDLSDTHADFDVLFFLQGAQDAFRIIVEAYAQGDRQTLRDLLGERVFEAFSQAIDAREQAGETLDTKIQKMRKVEICAVRAEGSMVYMTVRFVADEISVHKDREGRILAGDPGQINPIIDIWVFGRDMSTEDPRWFLYETRSEDPDDNDIIPNSH